MEKEIYMIIIEEGGVKMPKINRSNISVVIRTRNEERWIGHTIQSLLDHLIQPEIIIVDNNSTDNTLYLVKNFIQDPKINSNSSSNYTKIKLININNYTPGKALNLGVKKSTNKYIMFISAHCVLNKIDLQNHIKNLKKYCCVFGNQIPIWEGKKISKRYIWSHFGNKKVQNMYSKLEDRYFLHNALAIYNKKILKLHPFDEYLTGKEDRYWANEIINKKLNYLYDPSLEAFHHYTVNGQTWKGLG